VLAEAEREAGRIFGEAGLKTVWLDCTTRPTAIPHDSCQEAIEAEDVRLRILTSPVRNSLQDTVFGFAVAPVLATVYYESVLALAKYDEREFETPAFPGGLIPKSVCFTALAKIHTKNCSHSPRPRGEAERRRTGRIPSS
jgi:hypothetical protein